MAEHPNLMDPFQTPDGKENPLLNMRRMTSDQFAKLNDNIPTTPTSFRQSGMAAPLTLKEQEKLMDDMKKENFDLKLRVYHLEDRLRQMAPSNIDNMMKENEDLKVRNEALMTEIKAHQEVITEAHTAIEQYRQQSANRPAVDAEVNRLRYEVEQSNTQLQRAQAQCQKYETQLALFDKESRETMHKIKQAELEIGTWQRRLNEAQGTISRLEGEIGSLEEELQHKNTLIHQFRGDSHGMASDMEMLTKQIVDLQHALAATKEERDNLLKERDSIKKSFAAVDAIKAGAVPGSPRSSMDLLESKLMRELSQTTKRLQELERQSEDTLNEKQQIASQTRNLASDLEQATEAIKYLGQKLSNGQLSFAAQTSFPEVFKQVENVSEHLLRDCEEQRHAKAMLSDSLEKQERLVSDLQQERQRLEQQLGQTQGRLSEIQVALNEKDNEIERLEEMAQNYQSRASEAYERELPKLKAEIEQLREKLAQTTHDLDRSMQELVMTQQAAEDFKRRWEASEAQALEAGSAIADRSAQINQLQQARNDLVKKLSTSEEMVKSLNKRLEEMKGQLEHAEKVKVAVEEGFSRQIKALHSSNTELKLQLAANSNGTSDANARLERLHATVESLRAEKESLFARLQAKEHSLGSIQQDLETLRSEKKALESDLQLRHEQLRKLDTELTRLKKDDMYQRKNMDGMDHLQSKVDSLVALNNFLKEQVEQKDKMIRELEDRLRRQADDMRNAQSEVEQQSRRLKKRELLISQALKKLETINSLQLSAGPELTNGLGALANELNSHSYDYKPSINPHDVITPVRPSTKSANCGAYPSVPDMGSSYAGGQKRKEPTTNPNKENDYLYKNIEY